MTYLNDLDFHVISDTHFYDSRLKQFLGRPAGVDEAMIQNWRNTISPDMPILHLGDVVTERFEIFKHRIAPALTGKKYLIKGNYDTRDDSFYEDCGFEILDPFSIEKDGWTIYFTHEPRAKLDLTREVNVHGHIHNTQVDHTTRNHYNVCVEVRHYTPWYVGGFVDHLIKRAGEADISRDFHPLDLQSIPFCKKRLLLHGNKAEPNHPPEVG